MHLRKITSPQQASDRKLFLQIKQHHKTLHCNDPVFALLNVVGVQLDGFALGHEDEAVHVLLGGIFEVVALDPGIFDVENSPFLGVVLFLEHGNCVFGQHEVELFEVGLGVLPVGDAVVSVSFFLLDAQEVALEELVGNVCGGSLLQRVGRKLKGLGLALLLSLENGREDECVLYLGLFSHSFCCLISL